ncbi:hypothetical protein DY000_02047614 [Brassica cretica]|uniref:Transposase MuDR plant domain-containing protein n=1 Tax=Brassica cretica TaxID=69181 RepID=A0ABQ7EYJ3_BRACR|nr:hypothetical protein DY000_02047614 [Brassica cretica]
MAVRMDFVNLALCVTYGSQCVGHYRTIRREEFGLTEDGTDVFPPKPKPWRGYLQVSEERLRTICSKEHMDEIRRTAVRLSRSEITHPLTDIDAIPSESDSSDEMEVFTPDADGMIRLEELGTQQPEGAILTLAITATNAENARSGGSSNKGKGMMTEQPLKRKLYLDFESGSGSGNEEIDVGNGQQPDFEADEFGIQDVEAVLPNNHLFVGQVFVDRDAFKVHMSLYALANKYNYFVRRSEPGKVVLECSGVNCAWRVYAAKIPGCPRFEIKTLESHHRCSQWDDLDKKACSCKEFEILAIPCAYVVFAAIHARHSVESKVGVFYSNAYWAFAYSESINPVDQSRISAMKFGVEGEDGHLLPPATRRPPGRPRKSRIPSHDWFFQAPQDLHQMWWNGQQQGHL